MPVPVAFFDNQPIRRVYDEATETWWFSVVDIVKVLTQQPDATRASGYWRVLKTRLLREGSQTVTECNGLKLTADDGKERLTDCATAETLLRLIQSIPSPKAEPRISSSAHLRAQRPRLTRTYRNGTIALLAAIATPALLAATATSVDKEFVGKVSQGGAYEVAASKLAAERAIAPDVKDLALAEVHDHEGVGARLKSVAAATGVPVAAELNAEFSARLARLRAVPATDFDAAYIADMESIHDKDERLFAAEAQQGSDAYKTFAHNTDLIVKRHIGALHGLDH